MFFFSYTNYFHGWVHWVFKAVLTFQLHKKPLMLVCGNKDDGTCALVLAGRDGAWDVLDQTRQPKGQLRSDTSPRRLLV